jgi:uncharacterized membrane protein (DUF4010 family)
MDGVLAMTDVRGLAAALALGLLVGLERGWHGREAIEGGRVAGIRTFALLGLLGGSVMLLARESSLLLPSAFFGLTLLLLVAHRYKVRQDNDAGITTMVAALLTFALGALAVAGYGLLAVGVAIVTVFLLDAKTRLHDLLRRLSETELLAIFKLLLISVVALPLLPNRGFGPGEVLNPYEIWWLVVLIATLSSVGYFAMRLVGAARGLLLTGLLGGLASSTALTLSFARLRQRAPELGGPLAIGILLACAMMFPRIWIETVLAAPALAPGLVAPLLVMMLLPVAGLLRRSARGVSGEAEAPREIGNPFEIGTALKFGLLLTGVMLLSHFGRQAFGDLGVYLVAAVAAVGDVDAITLSLARESTRGLDGEVAQRAIVLSAAVNTVVKGLIAAAVGGGELWRRVTLPLALASVAGIAVAMLI